MVDFVARYWPTAIQVVLAISLLGIAWVYLPLMWGAPWVTSPPRVVAKMLRMAGVQPGQKVVDLGAGDGRIVIAAARSFGAHAVGVEIDPLRWLIANTLIALLGCATGRTFIMETCLNLTHQARMWLRCTFGQVRTSAWRQGWRASYAPGPGLSHTPSR